jgi:hypothetical protein
MRDRGVSVYLARPFRRLQKAGKDRASGPKSRMKRQTHTFDEVLGRVVDASDSAERLTRPTARLHDAPVLENADADLAMRSASSCPTAG